MRHRTILFQSSRLQQVKPAIAVSERIEIQLGRKRELVVGSVDGNIHACICRERNLEPRDHVAKIGKGDISATPRSFGATIRQRHVNSRRKMLGENVHQIHRSLGVRGDVRFEVALGRLFESETVVARSKAAPDCYMMRPATENHDVFPAWRNSTSRVFRAGSSSTN